VATSLWPLASAAMRRKGSSAAISALSMALRMVGLGKIADELKRAHAATQSRGRPE
jgi:hypothetical protein